MHRSNRLARSFLALALSTAGLALIALGPGAGEALGEATVAAHAQAPAAAAAAPAVDGLLPLPQFKPCATTSHPLLPAKWEAVALMQDFFLPSFLVGKFVFDESAQAFRFSLADQYGIDEDFLVTTNGKLYRLEGGEQPTSCRYMTARSPFTVPARDWLATGAACVGQAPILNRDQQWWKSKSGDGANWYWYNAGNRLPFRSMYYADVKPSSPAPIYEYFTLNYFPTFKAVPTTNLARLVALCQRPEVAATPSATADYARPSIDPILKKSTYPKINARQQAQTQQWIPGLTPCSSTGALPPPWPERVQGTVFLTAVSFPPNPFPSRVFYDWTKPAQNTTLYYFPPTAENYAQVAYLVGNTGYIAFQRQNGSFSQCQQALPGPPIRNWKEADHCQCRGELAPHTVLNPSAVPTKILWCPTDLAAKQVFWTWYSSTGTPVVFMQSNSSPTAGTGLNLADYYHWAPGSVAPPGTFDPPVLCKGKPVVKVPQACHNCHLPLNPHGPP